MKKEYIILGLTIAALSAYLVMHKNGRDNYILPSLPQINVADVAEIDLDKDGRAVILSKVEGSWVVGDKKYPAGEEGVTQILDIVKDLKLSALVSESGNLTPYELDSKNRINVAVKSKGETVRKFAIGKTAPSFRHTFVQLDGNSNVYHAAKSFRRDFDKTVADLRDKKVLSFDKNKISAITLKKGDKVREVAIKDGKAVESKVEKQDDKALDSKGDGSVKKGAANSPENTESLEPLLSMLSGFQCHTFTDTDSKDEFKGMTELCTITLKGDKEYTFSLYSKDAKGNYPALSSENSYPFLVESYQGDDLISKLDNLLGIKKEDNSAGQMVEKLPESTPTLPAQPSGSVPDPAAPAKEVPDPAAPAKEVTDPAAPAKEVTDPAVPDKEVTEPAAN